MSVRDKITHTHLMASSAIPFVFPAAQSHINGHHEYFGDSSMRQTAPCSPAIHLGAQRLMVVGAGRMVEPKDANLLPVHSTYPFIAQIAGHALSSIFLDTLAADVERTRRINQSIQLVPKTLRASSRLLILDLLVISPSKRLDMIAARHIDALPRAVRTMLDAVGVSSRQSDVKGSALRAICRSSLATQEN